MNRKTHGEAWFEREQSIELINGKFTHTLKNNIPPPMPPEEASVYYGRKFFEYWLEKLDDRIPAQHAKECLSTLVYGDPHTYKTKFYGE